jgi:hypothetical protein
MMLIDQHVVLAGVQHGYAAAAAYSLVIDRGSAKQCTDKGSVVHAHYR